MFDLYEIQIFETPWNKSRHMTDSAEENFHVSSFNQHWSGINFLAMER
jgi:hypothetical protein